MSRLFRVAKRFLSVPGADPEIVKAWIRTGRPEQKPSEFGLAAWIGAAATAAGVLWIKVKADALEREEVNVEHNPDISAYHPEELQENQEKDEPAVADTVEEGDSSKIFKDK